MTQTSKIAVIGPMAQNREHLLGSWAAHGSPEDVTSIYDGLKSEFGVKSSLSYAKGCDFDGTDTIGFSEARSVAKVADVVVICIGEKRGWSGENASRSTLALPQIQEELVREIKKLGKPIVLLLSNGRPLELNKLEPICDAIVEMWQPGVVGGIPVAEVISGKINPSGKLSMTFPYSTGQIPIYYNMRQSARPAKGKYKDIPTTALYEFAYGLSYTSYQYADLKASNSSIKRTQKLTIEIPVTNTGARDGDETVHWYISDPYCSISRPIKELKYFEKQQIKSGETKIFHFELDPMRDLSFVDGNGTQFLEKGDYYIIVKDKKIKIEVTD